MTIPMVDLKRQYRAFKTEIDAAINDVLDQTQFILGPNVNKLEEEVAAYHQLPYAIGVANGTDALLLALRACGIKAGDEVITTSFTFIATAEVIAQLAAIPVFVDICPDTFNIDPALIVEKITPKTKAIIPVHLFGHPADMDPIMEIAAKHNLKIIEDCAQAFGAKYKKQLVGTIGDAGCFSFFPSKNLGGYGDGGMVVTKSEEIAKQIKILRNHGSSIRYHHSEVGYNSRLDEIQAAIIRVKLKHIDQFNSARRKNAAAYCAAINKQDIILPSAVEGSEHVYHQFTIRAKNRDAIAKALHEKEIASAIYYPVALHQQEVFIKLYNSSIKLPVSEMCAQEVLSLPMFPELTVDEIRLIADVINMPLEGEIPLVKEKTVMIIAGEASGDMHGASLVREMLKIDPTFNFYGIGGNKLGEAGVKLMANASEMAVVGLTEAISKLGKFIRILNEMKKSMDDRKPDLVILIDYPDFNLPLAKAARKRGIKVFYYISPQVWAWRKGRIGQIKNSVDKMAVILPFEVNTYSQEDFTVDYVGHPLLDLVKPNYSKSESRERFNLSANKTTIGLLPGSRISEVEKLLPEMLQAAAILSQKIPDIQFALPLADTLEETIISGIISSFGIKVNVIRGNTYDVISCADLAIVASGTATLETALLKVPMIIVYKVSPFSYFVGKLAISVNNIGLVNIIAGKTIVPELIQDMASGENIANEAMAILTNDQRKLEIIRELAEIRAKLGNPGAAIRAAKLACDML